MLYGATFCDTASRGERRRAVATDDRTRRARFGGAPEALADDELFACSPAGFVAARNALARRLRSEGDREAAEEVSRLRRPTQSVWALNQVARQDAALVAALGKASERLRVATEEALAGDSSALRPAQDAERAAIDDVVEAAEAHLIEAGEPANAVVHQRMLDTLRATSTDPPAAALLRAGRLTEDLASAGLGLDGFAGSLAPSSLARRRSRSRVATPPATVNDAEQKAAKRIDLAQARWAELDRAARQAEADARSFEHDARRGPPASRPCRRGRSQGRAGGGAGPGAGPKGPSQGRRRAS